MSRDDKREPLVAQLTSALLRLGLRGYADTLSVSRSPSDYARASSLAHDAAVILRTSLAAMLVHAEHAIQAANELSAHVGGERTLHDLVAEENEPHEPSAEPPTRDDLPQLQLDAPVATPGLTTAREVHVGRDGSRWGFRLIARESGEDLGWAPLASLFESEAAARAVLPRVQALHDKHGGRIRVEVRPITTKEEPKT